LSNWRFFGNCLANTANLPNQVRPPQPHGHQRIRTAPAGKHPQEIVKVIEEFLKKLSKKMSVIVSLDR
jgi:hypothetical protein